MRSLQLAASLIYRCNSCRLLGTKPTCPPSLPMSASRGKATWRCRIARRARQLRNALIAEAAPRWRAKTNHWRAITSLNPMFRVTHRRPRVRTRGQTNVDWQNRTMTRYDVLVWLSLAGVFTAYCVTMWAFFPLGD